MIRTLASFGSLFVVCLVLGPTAQGAADEAELAAAKKMLLGGRYAEAVEKYLALAESSPVESALGLARCLVETGEAEQAVRNLTNAAAANPDSAAIPGELATLALDRGDFPAAREWVGTALKLDESCLAARWVAAELSRVSGRLDEANDGYRWFVDHYNNAPSIDDPEALCWIGRGAAMYARWNRLHDQFRFLVNELYADALAAEPAYWPAAYEAGLLFLEKYNEADASRELKQALALNPQSASVHAALAALDLQNYELETARQFLDSALELNPKLLWAHQLKADWLMADFRVEDAAGILEQARELNPTSEETLGRLAAAYLLLDGERPSASGRYQTIIDEVTARNPHAGVFFHTLAARLEERRKFTAAGRYFERAIQEMPRHIGPKAGLGMMLMRLGDEKRAQELLDAAFEEDPFNVRVSNTLKVLEVLAGYETLETDHFLIKYDPEKDELLARHIGEYLESEVYPSLCGQFGFEPEGKSLFEIFNHAKNTNGHGWFSARMIGLPYIGTVGACAGKMVALASPNDMKEKFNWARVVKHEFVHVLNLQQTDFNIPHWYTEALATLNEGYPRSEDWNRLLARRMASGELYNLDTINLGFIRPQSSDGWQMAYCQAELYAEYMLATYGDDALARLLTAYAENLTTRAALQQAFGVEQEAFESGYLEYVRRIVAEIPAASQRTARPFAELIRAQAESPDDPDLAAELAEAQLLRKAYPEARRLAEAALANRPNHPLASYVVARLRLLIGESSEAVAILEACLDRDNPHPQVVGLLANQWIKDKKYPQAAELYRQAADKDPSSASWIKGLARVYLLSGDNEKLADVLAQLTEQDADDVTVRKKLAQLALAANDHESTVRWATQALQIDVLDAETHRMLGDAHAANQDQAAAIECYETALSLNPEDEQAQAGLAAAKAK